MAVPPDPIEEVLPKATWVIDAEVVEVVKNGPPVPKVEAPPGHTGVGQKVGSQVVRLAVRRVLRGKPDAKDLVVEKPVAAYGLRVGNQGPFLLEEGQPHPLILGRYGPDTYSWDRIEAALKGK
ncbi:MAG: hypothetical protein HYZ28_20810 [Myxococcales bacterium]|nr:hypothetical protein [Myxococcales bacterium]